LLDATMAATALVATADGEVNLSELSALDSVLESVQDLQIYDPHVAVDIYRDFADAIAENPKVGRRRAMAAVARVDDDHEAAELVIRVAVAISKADGELSDLEARAISDLCGTLGVALPAQT
jgi:tellurite resistance protein TerB